MIAAARRSVAHAPLALAVLVSLLGGSGCLSPYLRRASDVPEPRPSPALVAGFVVRFDSGNQEKSLLDAAVDAAQNSGLDEFGKRATGLLAAALEERGYTTAYDGPRSSRLDAVQISSNAGTAALTGQWRHPDASYWVPQTVDSLFVKPADIIGKIKVDGQKEYFVFADVTIRDGGWIMKAPFVVVKAVVYDDSSRKVLELQGLGSGSSGFLFADRSPSNLEAALNNAFASLKTVAEEPLP